MVPYHLKQHYYIISRLFVISFLVLISSAGILMAQESGTLNGDVKDADGLPLPGVNVTASGSGGTRNSYTDAAGHFVLPGLATGTYDVTVELSGFVTITQTDVQVSAGDNNIVFTMKTGGLAELIVVTASKVETPLINAPATMSVVRSDTIQSSPAQNYADLLRSVPGLNVTQTSARDINLTSRQANSTLATSQLALLDGRSIYLDFFGFIAWDFLPVNFDEIKQIEVIRGPASAVWGANAQTGVVNIITKPPRETTGTSIVVTGGTFDAAVDDDPNQESGSSFGANVRFAQAVNDTWAYKISAGYYNSDAYARPFGTIPIYVYPAEEGERPRPVTSLAECLPPAICSGGASYQDPAASYLNDGTSQPKFDVRVDQELGSDSRLSYAGGVAGTDGIIHTGLGPFQIDSGSILGYGKVGYDRGNFKFNFFTNILDADSHALLARGANGQLLPFAFKSQTYDFEAGDSRVIADKHILSYGGNYRRNNFDLEIAPQGDDRNEVGGYIQDEFFTDKFRLVVGGRVDKFSVIDDPVFSPRITGMYKPTPSHSIRASFNKAFRSPSQINNFLDTAIIIGALNLRVLEPILGQQLPCQLLNNCIFPIITPAHGNPNLKEESLTAYEVGYTGEFNGRTTVSVAFYINDLNDSINFVPSPIFYSSAHLPPLWPAQILPSFLFDILLANGVVSGQPPFPSGFNYLNIGPLRNRGVEVGFDSILNENVSVFANYSWQDNPEILDPDPGQLRYPVTELTFPPHHRFNAGANFNTKKYLGSASVNYTADAFWTDVLTLPFFGPTDAFTTVNVSFGVRWLDGRVTTSIKVNNLFNEDAQQHVFGDVIKRSVIGEARFDF